PEKYRIIIILCDLEGKTRKEAAQQLGCPEGTAAGWLARARALLAKRLARHGLAVSGGSLAVVLSENASSAGVPTAQRATGAVSALAEGVLKTMLLAKLKMAVGAVLTAAGLACCGVGLATHSAPAGLEHTPSPEALPVAPPK